jgi:Ca2+-binding RTX toxin-like protein
MKPTACPGANLLCWGLLTAAFHATGISQAATDPTLPVTLNRTGQSVVVSWLGVSAVPYQLESSSNLVDWASAGPVLIGTGSPLSSSNSVIGQSRNFFRVKRVFPAAPGTASFDPLTGVLTIVGDAAHTVINVANDGFGNIVVNSGAILITGGVPTVSNTVLIQILGSAGDDQISVANGLPPAHIFGAEGNDTLTGGSAADMIVGGPGIDTIIGRQGNDLLYPDGGDTVVWNPGDGSDTVQGQGDNNTLLFNASNASENMDLSANGSRLRLFRDMATSRWT